MDVMGLIVAPRECSTSNVDLVVSHQILTVVKTGAWWHSDFSDFSTVDF